MPYQVTSHADMADALRPDAFYPQIQSNGAVSTDEEGNSETDTSSDEESTPNNNNNATTVAGRRKPGTVPTHKHLRRLNYNPRNNHRINGNLFHSPLQPQSSKPQPTARLARDDEDMRVGPARAWLTPEFIDNSHPVIQLPLSSPYLFYYPPFCSLFYLCL